jgi:arylsulfatase A-like enzyme
VDPAYEGPADGTTEQMKAYNQRKVTLTEEDVGHNLNLYRANLQQVDRRVAELLEAVDLESTLVVVLSDHGEAFDQHKRLGHSWLSYEEYVRIPLILDHPRLPRGVVVSEPVMSIDVLPTLIELFALDAPDIEPQGRSLLGVLGGEPLAREAVFTSSRRNEAGRQDLAVFDGRHKLLVRLPTRRTWLFDLEDDPGETTDLSEERPEEVERLSTLLEDWWRRQRPLLAEDRTLGLDPDDEEQLRELGYIK